MVLRKTLKLGGSTLIISLPRDWVRSNSLHKGDFLEVLEKGNELVIRIADPDFSKLKKLALRAKKARAKREQREIVSEFDKEFTAALEYLKESKLSNKELLEKHAFIQDLKKEVEKIKV